MRWKYSLSGKRRVSWLVENGEVSEMGVNDDISATDVFGLQSPLFFIVIEDRRKISKYEGSSLRVLVTLGQRLDSNIVGRSKDWSDPS